MLFFLKVPAKGQESYAIEFFPLSMTSSSSHPEEHPEAQSKATKAGDSSGGQKSSGDRQTFHDREGEETPAEGKPAKLTGSLFFALPDGGAVLYLLEGVADGPEAASVVELESPAKTELAFTVPVCNWLRRPQRCVMKHGNIIFLIEWSSLEVLIRSLEVFTAGRLMLPPYLLYIAYQSHASPYSLAAGSR